MHTDRYTRIMLTIIAAALVWICLRDTAPPVLAASPVFAEATQTSVDVSGIYRYVRRIARGSCANSKIC